MPSTTEGLAETSNRSVADLPDPVRVPVGRSRFAIIDAADLDLVAAYRWYPRSVPTARTVYAVAHCPKPGGGRTSIGMHRLIAATPAGFHTDHADGDGLNNRRANLRTATRAQNQANAAVRSGRYKGIYPNRNRWRAEIRANGTRLYLGYFADEESAARAYDAAALAAYGEFARLNFPQEVTA